VTELEFVDCQCFAGGLTLGAVQAGWTLRGKREHAGGFGAPACEANRHLLGDAWETQATQAEEWEVIDVPAVFGNPPCSGFSLMSNKDFRGVDSKINSCMWDLVGYAARCDVDVMVMESVGQAYTTGHELMTGLLEKMQSLSKGKWKATHVLQDAYSLGGCAIRRRYFLVLHRVPFGVEPFDLRAPLPTLGDAISDLQDLPLTWELQPHRYPPTAFGRKLRGRTRLVDGHVVADTVGVRRITELVNLVDWKERGSMADAMRSYWEEHDDLPPMWATHAGREKILSQAPDFNFGYNQPIRWRWNHPARVITGGALFGVVHPTRPRTITHREALRVLGYPDAWRVSTIENRTSNSVAMFWGKGVTVDTGRWIAEWVRRSLEGSPGTLAGEPVGESEVLVDVSKDWRRLVAKDGRPIAA
jgi:site-specific DNA-cytosine methylase